MLFTGCHYVDPQCLGPGFGVSARRQHGVLLQLSLTLKHKRYTESLSLAIDGAGGVELAEIGGAVTTCRRVTNEEDKGLANLWSGEALPRPLPQCGPGYAYTLYDERACRESLRELNERRRAFLPQAWVLYNAGDRRVSFSWDLESELPEELEEAFTSTLGLLCGETSLLAMKLRRSMPELAARAGC